MREAKGNSTPLPFRQVHLDFHTNEQILRVGDCFDPADFAQALKKAHVNSVNLFACCHHGMCYYDTKLGVKHPGLRFDMLTQQIDACHAAGIQCPIYVTVCWDEHLAKHYPQWLERDADGRPFGAGPLQPGWKKLCLNTAFVEYFEERMDEILAAFGGRIDGFWIDIVFQNPCCCNYCLESMLSKGLNPDLETDRWTHSDEVLVAFKQRITARIRQQEPDCLIFYNAGHIGPYIRSSIDCYTHLELESLPGCRAGWGYDHLPISVSFARTLDKPCIGMTGKFHRVWGDFGGYKNQAALEYECFTSLAHGAMCCIGDQLHPCGELDAATYELIGNVYAQVEQKEQWCVAAEALTEIGVITPESAVGTRHYHLNAPIRGAYRMLTESHYQFDVLDRYSTFQQYKLVVFPDDITFDAELAEKTAGYLADGGKILLSHHAGLDEEQQYFILPDIGLRAVSDSHCEHEFVVPRPGSHDELREAGYVVHRGGMWVEAGEDWETLAGIGQPYFNRTWRHFYSHLQAPMEKMSAYPAAVLKNNAAYFAHPLFALYHQYAMRAHKLLVLSALRRLLPEKLIETNAPSSAHLHLNHQPHEKRYVLHILHYIPEARSLEMDTIEEAIPIDNVRVKLQLAHRIERAQLAPSLTKLPFEQTNGRVAVTIPRVLGHEMVVMEYK